MTMKEITLKITAEIKQKGGEDSDIELISEGQYYNKNNSIYLMYEESEVSGMKGGKTALIIRNGIVTMKRFGTGSADMIFEKGKRNNSDYHTPYGVFDMEIFTDALKIDLVESGDGIRGHIDITYLLSIKNLSESKNRLRIEVY